MTPVPIIYEDDFVVVVNKPAGLIVHGDGKKNEPALTDWIREQYPHLENIGEPMLVDGKEIPRPGIVHRLDRETSGVLVIAKDQATFLNLKQQFQERKTAKIYHAFVYGVLKEKRGSINLPIGRSARSYRLLSAERGARPPLREAVTEYAVLKDSGEFSFLEVQPKTGRTNQIRVHLKAIGHPVVCDKQYAPKRPCALRFERLALHASSLTFMLPNGCSIKAEAPFPEDFEKALKHFAS